MSYGRFEGLGRRNAVQKRVQCKKLVYDNVETLRNQEFECSWRIDHFSAIISPISTIFSTFLKKWTLSCFAWLFHRDSLRAKMQCWSSVLLLEVLDENQHIDEVKKIIVEDSLSGFAKGFTRMQTIIKLAKINSVICFLILHCQNFSSSLLLISLEYI